MTEPAPGPVDAAAPRLRRRPHQQLPPWGMLVGALAIVYVVWGSTYLGIRILVEEAPPLTSIGQRYIAGGVLLGLILAAKDGVHRLRATPRELVGCAVLGLFLPLLGNGMVAVGESRGATSSITALLIAVSPLAIVIFRTIERDRPRPMTVVGVLTGFVGLSVLVLLGRSSGDAADSVPLHASLIVLFAGTCWALGSYLQPKLWLPADPFVIAVFEMVFGGVMLTVVGIAVGESWTLDYGSRTWWAMGYLVVFGSVVAFSAYVWLLARAPISLVATYAYVNPVVAVFLGWLILDEAITTATVVGGSIVVGAVAVVITAERQGAKA